MINHGGRFLLHLFQRKTRRGMVIVYTCISKSENFSVEELSQCNEAAPEITLFIAALLKMDVDLD